MRNQDVAPAFQLGVVRREIIQYLEPLPDMIRLHRGDCIGSATLALGKCLAWIGPTLDQYSVTQPLPGAPPPPRVSDLGEKLRVLGLEILATPSAGDLQKTIATLKRQTELLQKIAVERSADR